MGDADAIIQRVVDHKRALREHRNSLAPVSRCPAETLSQIFRYFTPLPSQYNDIGLALAFSQVCRRWRSVALGNPALWTTPICHYPLLGLEMIARAQNLPLCVTVDCRATLQSFEVATGALDKQSNLKRLAMTASGEDMARLLTRITGPLSQLEDLTLEVAGQRRVTCANLEASSPPRLRRLHLRGCILPWSARCLENLTTLDIRLEPSDSESERSEFASVLATIKNNKRLRRLILTNVISIPVDAVRPNEMIVLDHLEYLGIGDHIAHMIYFFWHLAFPNVSNIWISNDGNEREESAVAVAGLLRCLNKWMVSHAQLDDIRVFTCKILPWKGEVQFVLHCEEESIGIADSSDVTLRVSLKLAISPTQTLIKRTLERIVRTFDLKHLTACSIEVGPGCENEHVHPIWDHILPLPQLHTLELRKAALFLFLETFEAAIAEQRIPLPFPALDLLFFNDVDFCSRDKKLKMTPLRRLARVMKYLADKGQHMSDIGLCNCKSWTDPQVVFQKFGVEVTDVLWTQEPQPLRRWMSWSSVSTVRHSRNLFLLTCYTSIGFGRLGRGEQVH